MTFEFEVIKLPFESSFVECPLKEIQVLFDGELDTWNYPISCNNVSVVLDKNSLLQPYLQGETSSTNFGPDAIMQLVPNPSEETITIKNIEPANKTYEIISIDGILYKEGIMKENYLNISDLPSGIYIFHLKGRQEFKRKFIKI